MISCIPTKENRRWKLINSTFKKFTFPLESARMHHAFPVALLMSWWEVFKGRKRALKSNSQRNGIQWAFEATMCQESHRFFPCLLGLFLCFFCEVQMHCSQLVDKDIISCEYLWLRPLISDKIEIGTLAFRAHCCIDIAIFHQLIRWAVVLLDCMQAARS